MLISTVPYTLENSTRTSTGYCTVMWWNFPFVVSLYVSELYNVTKVPEQYPCIDRIYRDRETETETERDRQTDRHRQRQRDRDRDRDRQTDGDTDRDRDRDRDRYRDR